MSSRIYYKALDAFYRTLSKPEASHFFKGNTINPLKIFTLSKQFPNLKLSEEDLLLLYSADAQVETATVAITTMQIHYKASTLGLEKTSLSKIVDIDTKHNAFLQSFVDDVLLVKSDEKRDLASFTDKFKDFVNQKESENKDYDIDYDFLQILQKEGEKIQGLCKDLNNNKAFANALNTILKSNENATHFVSEHVVLYDIIKVFNLSYGLSDTQNKTADVKIKFLLAFLFEKLQGNDLIKSLSLDRINAFVLSEKFDTNIEIIKNAQFFNLGEDYKKEFLLPSILKRLDNPHFTDASTFLYRIASLITKADGTISEKEKEILQLINTKIAKPKQKLGGVTQVEVDENEILEDVLDELNGLIGLDNIKQSVQELANFLKVQKIREAQGLKAVNNSLHSVFMGPPGTGKTTVARLVSKIYKHLGYLENGHLVETDRSGLVAGYVGQTALKVNEVVKTAIHGVLFIDEAYALTTGNSKDFGNEAVEILLKKMEDHRKELVVIAAGYPDEMETFIESNPGLQSRFNRYFNFDHYKPKEMLGIFQLFCKKNDFVLTEDAAEKMEFIFEKLYEKRHQSFGNGRVARNLFEKIIEYQANRIVSITPLTPELLKTITEEDVPPINQTVEDYLRFQDDDV
ncbi:hypothetical protein MHTCC0001_34970 [Flavobacteriaceae bacterium MHTCC 0001]